MIIIHKDSSITLKWSIFKGTSKVLENFGRSILKVFLVGSDDKWVLSHTITDGKLVVSAPANLPNDTYSIEAIWIKNPRHLVAANATDHGTCYSRVSSVFAITNNIAEATNDGDVTLLINSHVATYGYDGLNAYEMCVLYGKWGSSQSSFLTSKLGQTLSASDLANGIITWDKLASALQTIITGKADKSTTYTKTEVDTKVALKADKTVVDAMDKTTLTVKTTDYVREKASNPTIYSKIIVVDDSNTLVGTILPKSAAGTTGWLYQNGTGWRMVKSDMTVPASATFAQLFEKLATISVPVGDGDVTKSYVDTELAKKVNKADLEGDLATWKEFEIDPEIEDIASKVNQITPEEEGTSGQVLTLNDEGKAEWKTPQGGGGGTVDAYTKSESDAKYATKEEIEGVVYEEESEELPDGEDVIQKVADLPILPKHYENTLYITDKEGNVIAKIDGSGLETTSIKARNVQYKDWNGKTIATYGDSVVAINNGDSSYPYGDLSTSFNWGKRVAQYFGFAKNYGRGIGGQGYKWTTSGGSGGSVSFIEANGNLNSRNDNYNLDNYTGEIPSGCTAVRGCLASWLRITKMFPASIKDNIDVVLVMAHNDGFDSTDCAFVANDTTDTEWANSGADYYGKINGDYNLTTLKGGIASTLMKLQLWMPNAIIVIMTGISGQGTSGQLNTAINGVLTKNAESVREMSKLTSIPCIDTFASDGINGWNRTSYIADTIHPYNVEGSKMFARSVVGGLKSIMPKDSLNF